MRIGPPPRDPYDLGRDLWEWVCNGGTEGLVHWGSRPRTCDAVKRLYAWFYSRLHDPALLRNLPKPLTKERLSPTKAGFFPLLFSVANSNSGKIGFVRVLREEPARQIDVVGLLQPQRVIQDAALAVASVLRPSSGSRADAVLPDKASGDSVGLSSVVAAIAIHLGQSVPDDWAATGTWDTDEGLLKPVSPDTLYLKVQLALDWGYRKLLVVEGQKGLPQELDVEFQSVPRYIVAAVECVVKVLWGSARTQASSKLREAHERAHLVRRYCKDLIRDRSSTTVLGRSVQLKELYIPVYGQVEPEPPLLADTADDGSGTHAGEVQPASSVEGATLFEWEAIRARCGLEMGGPGLRIDNPAAWVILGNAGDGKTTWIEHEVLIAAEQASELASLGAVGFRIPCFFEAKTYNPPNAEAPTAYLANQIGSRLGLAEGDRTLLALVRWAWDNGRLAFFFDAFDEAEPNRQHAVRATARAALKRGCLVFITALTATWRRDTLDHEYRFHLASLSPSAINSFICKWFSDSPAKAKDLARRFKGVSRLLELAHNPLMLSFICDMWGASTSPSDFPYNRAGLLYSSLARLMTRPDRAEMAARFQPSTKIQVLRLLARHRVASAGPITAASASEVLRGFAPQDRKSLLDELTERDGVLVSWTEEFETYYDFAIALLGDYLAAYDLAYVTEWSSTVANSLSEPTSWAVLPLLAGEFCRRHEEGSARKLLSLLSANLTDASETSLRDGTHAALARVLAECLLECTQSLPADDLALVWRAILGVLDTSQARRRERQWKDIAQPHLVSVSLLAAERHVPGSRTLLARSVRTLLKERRSEALEVLLGDPCPLVRWLAIWYAAHFGIRALFRPLVERLEDVAESPRVRAIAARAVVELNGGKTEDCIERSLDDPCDEVATGAAIALGYTSEPQTLDLLITKASETSASLLVRASVLGALDIFIGRARKGRSLTEEARSRLAALFIGTLQKSGGEPAEIRSTVTSALGKLGCIDACGILKTLAFGDDVEATVRASACFALEQLLPSLASSDRSELREFVLACLTRREATVQIRRVAASTLGKFENPSDIDILLRVLCEEDDHTVLRCAFFSVLGLMVLAARPRVVKVLVELPIARLASLLGIVRDHPSPAGVGLCLDLLDAADEAPGPHACRKTVLFALSQIIASVTRRVQLGASELARCLQTDLVAKVAAWCMDQLENPSGTARSASLGVLAALGRGRVAGFADNPSFLTRAGQLAVQCLSAEDNHDQASALALFQSLACLHPTPFGASTLEAVSTFCLEGLEAQEGMIRASAARTLGYMDLPMYILPLQQALEDQVPMVRREAQTALVRLLLCAARRLRAGETVRANLAEFGGRCIALARCSDPRIAAAAMRVIYALKGYEAWTMPEDVTEAAAELACEQITHQTDPLILASALGLVRRLASSRYMSEQKNRDAALMSARDWLDHIDERVRASAAGVLGVLGQPADVDRLEGLRPSEVSSTVLKSLEWALRMLKRKLRYESRKTDAERACAEYYCPSGFLLGLVERVHQEAGRGFGFIRCTDGRQFYFNSAALSGVRWDDISEKMVVVFQVKRESDRQKAGAAKNVRPASSRRMQPGDNA